MGRHRSLTVGAKKGNKQPKSEWTIVEGVHEPIVTNAEFEQANQVIRQKKQRKYLNSQDYALKGKVRCGNCRRCLYYEHTTYQEYFVCRHERQLGEHSECCTEKYPVKQVDEIVWKVLKDHISTLESLGLKAADMAKKQMRTAKTSRTAIVTSAGFDDETIRQIRQYMNPPDQLQKPPVADKPPMEIWQKLLREWRVSADSGGLWGAKLRYDRRSGEQPLKGKS